MGVQFSGNILVQSNGGPLPISLGGTGQTTASLAINALLPDQSGHVGQFLKTDGTNISWDVGGSGAVTSVTGTGTVSGLTLTGNVTTSGSLTLGGTLLVTPANFASQSANTFLSAPDGSNGTPIFRSIVVADIPILNQNTTGSASIVTAAAQPSITSVGTLTSLGVTGTVTAGSFSGPADGMVLTGYASSAGTVAATDNVVAAIGKLNGNIEAARTITFNNQSGTTYTTVLTDATYAGQHGNMIIMNNAAAQTITIPPNSSVAYPVGASIQVTTYGTGMVTFAPGAGVTLYGTTGFLSIGGQYGAVSLIQTSENVWLLTGFLQA